MNLNQFTIKAQEAIQKAQEIAQLNNNQSIENVHLLKGIIDCDEKIGCQHACFFRGCTGCYKSIA